MDLTYKHEYCIYCAHYITLTTISGKIHCAFFQRFEDLVSNGCSKCDHYEREKDLSKYDSIELFGVNDRKNEPNEPNEPNKPNKFKKPKKSREVLPFVTKKEERVFCPICNRKVPYGKWERHHLIPRAVGGAGRGTVHVCVNCGDVIHRFMTHKELRDTYNTIDRIKENADIKNWIEWVAKKPDDFNICMKELKRKK